MSSYIFPKYVENFDQTKIHPSMKKYYKELADIHLTHLPDKFRNTVSEIIVEGIEQNICMTYNLTCGRNSTLLALAQYVFTENFEDTYIQNARLSINVYEQSLQVKRD